MDYRLDYEQFKTNALRLMTGFPCRGLNHAMRTDVFEESEKLYYYKVDGNAEVEALRQMSAHSFTIYVFKDLLQGIEDKANYADHHIFRRHVFQKYLAVLFLC